MDKLVKRVTLVQRGSAGTETTRIYKSSEKKKRKVSAMVAPRGKAARKLSKANVGLGQEMVSRTDKANRRKRDGWLFDGPIIVAKSGRAAYNQARKAVPFGLLPKA